MKSAVAFLLVLLILSASCTQTEETKFSVAYTHESEAGAVIKFRQPAVTYRHSLKQESLRFSKAKTVDPDSRSIMKSPYPKTSIEQDLEDLLSTKFATGRVLCSKDSNFPEFSERECLVDKIQGEVLESYNYWERLQIVFAIIRSKDTVTISVTLDGWYAAGARPPRKLSGYSDMEKSNDALLSSYLRMNLIPGIVKKLQQRELVQTGKPLADP